MEPKKKGGSKVSPDLRAIAAIQRILGPLNDADKVRVMRFVNEKFCLPIYNAGCELKPSEGFPPALAI